MDEERFVRELAAALPEAFAGVDLEEELHDEEDDCWLTYPAINTALGWIQRRAIKVRIGRRARLRRGGDEPLGRHRRGWLPITGATTVTGYSRRNSRSLAHLGSGAVSWAWSGPAWLRSAPHCGHSPAQSGRQTTWLGSASA